MADVMGVMGVEVRGRQDSRMTTRFLERILNYLYFVVILLEQGRFEGVLLGSS